jgi:hypothetical protein
VDEIWDLAIHRRRHGFQHDNPGDCLGGTIEDSRSPTEDDRIAVEPGVEDLEWNGRSTVYLLEVRVRDVLALIRLTERPGLLRNSLYR